MLLSLYARFRAPLFLAIALAAPPSIGAAQAANPVSADYAAAVFDAVCGNTLPNFSGANRAMKANSFTQGSPTGSAVRYSTKVDASFSVTDGPGAGKTCTLVFRTPVRERAVRAAFDATAGQKKLKVNGNDLYLYKGRGALFSLVGPIRAESKTYFKATLLSER